MLLSAPSSFQDISTFSDPDGIQAEVSANLGKSLLDLLSPAKLVADWARAQCCASAAALSPVLPIFIIIGWDILNETLFSTQLDIHFIHDGSAAGRAAPLGL
jgi:hypothetical protein